MLDNTLDAELVMNLSGLPMFPTKKKKKKIKDDIQEGIHEFQVPRARRSCCAMEGPSNKGKSMVRPLAFYWVFQLLIIFTCERYS